jgi:acetyl esterase/lipase
MVRPLARSIAAAAIAIASPIAAGAQVAPPLPKLPEPLGIPAPAPAGSLPYAPQPIVPGGIVVPLYPPGSPFLKADRVREAETYNMSQTVPGRIGSIVNIHNPSIEIHKVDRGINTGAVAILVAGGGHNTLNVGTESADFVPFFYNYGVNTVILRNRLRKDGYDVAADAVRDAQQAIRLVRAHAAALGFDAKKIGIIGFSAGAELSSATAVLYEDFDTKHRDLAADPLAGVSSRPDWVGIIYPGPTPFAKNRTAPAIPKDVPPAFIASGASGDRGHAIWAMDYFGAMLALGVPNIEMHLYGNGRHPGDTLPDGSRQSGGLTDRGDIPLGTWQARFVDWFRDLGFLQKPGVETKAARDVAAFVAEPPKPAR